MKSVTLPPGYVHVSQPWKASGSGFLKGHALKSRPIDEEKQRELRSKKAWDIAYAGAKSLPMNLLMMYMSGNSLQIFSILITVMMFWNPIKAILAVNKTFAAYEKDGDVNVFKQKAAYVALQVANMLLAVYKCQQMGLLPTTESDWLAFMGGIEPAPTVRYLEKDPIKVN